jgi:hypothetical protein
LAFFSEKTPISLNNSGDGVAVLSPDKKQINASPDDCGKAKEGASYAFDGKNWQWTEKPTPGKANIIKKVPENDDKENKDGEVLSLIDESDLPSDEEVARIEAERSKNDRILGYALIVLAIVGGISYTLYTYKEKLLEKYKNKFRGTDYKLREKIRKIRERR